MSGKTPTKFAEQGRNLAFMAYDHKLPKSAVGRALEGRRETFHRSLLRAGYPKAYCYSILENNVLTVIFDETPGKGDGWAVVFALDDAPMPNHQYWKLRERDFVYVPDVDSE